MYVRFSVQLSNIGYGTDATHSSDPATFREDTTSSWQNIVTAAQVAEQNAAYLSSFGSLPADKTVYPEPPADALKEVTFSVNGTQLLQYASMNGVTVSAAVLIDDKTFASKSSPERRIISDMVNSFIFTNGAAGALLVPIAYGGQPMDDISEADEASLIAKANTSAKKIEADQEVEQQKLEELIGEYGKLMQIEEDIASNYREIANNIEKWQKFIDKKLRS